MAFGETAAKPKPKPDPVKKIQEIAAQEAERKRQEEAAKRKKDSGVKTNPSSGVLGRVYDYFMGSSEKK